MSSGCPSRSSSHLPPRNSRRPARTSSSRHSRSPPSSAGTAKNTTRPARHSIAFAVTSPIAAPTRPAPPTTSARRPVRASPVRGARPRRRLPLLEAELGVTPDLLRDGDDRLGVALDRRVNALQLLACHTLVDGSLTAASSLSPGTNASRPRTYVACRCAGWRVISGRRYTGGVTPRAPSPH